MAKAIDIAGQAFGRLIALEPTEMRKNGKIVWKCQCNCEEKTICYVPITYLRSGQTTSCGCLKREIDEINLRNKYDEKRKNNIAIQLFDDTPRKDSSTGFRGVTKYFTRVNKYERYRAWITVGGKQYFKHGFLTAEDAYTNGRLKLEEEYLNQHRYEER